MIIERKQGRRLEAAALPLFLWGEVAVRVEVAAGVLGRGGGGLKEEALRLRFLCRPRVESSFLRFSFQNFGEGRRGSFANHYYCIPLLSWLSFLF